MRIDSVYYRFWIENREITEAWQQQLMKGEDFFGLQTENPDLESFRTLRDNEGQSPLHYYCLFAKTDDLMRLIRSTRIPSDLWLESNQYGENYLHYLAGRADQALLEFLLSPELPKILKPLRSRTTNMQLNIFHFIGQGGDLKAIQFILSPELPNEFITMLSAEDSEGRNVFHFTARSGNLEAIKFILSLLILRTSLLNLIS